jgi:hypothetical protein
MSRIVLLILLWVTVTNAKADGFEKFFPQNVKLGLSVDQLKAIRPDAVQSMAALLPRSNQAHKTFEMIERISPATYQTYVFSDNILQAVIWSEPVISSLPSLINPSELSNSLSQEFQFVRSDKIARASGTLEHFPVTADLWNDSKTGLQAYFISTSQETTLIFFNPSKLNGGNFFVGADKIPELKADADAIRSQTKTDPKASPPLIDRPWEARTADSPAQSSSVSVPALSQNITNEIMRVDAPQPVTSTFPFYLEQAQVSPRISYFVVLAVLLAIGTSVFFFIFKRR